MPQTMEQIVREKLAQLQQEQQRLAAQYARNAEQIQVLREVLEAAAKEPENKSV